MELRYSVLMSVYAKEKPEYFRLALDSMINQTAKPDEIVIVQDGPLPKDLYNTVWSYSERYPELIKIIVSEKNIGLGLALNLGLQHCRNDLVARMDTDDISKPERCEKQLKMFSQNPKLGVVGSDICEFIDKLENVIARRIVPRRHQEIAKYMKRRCPFNHMTVMFRKSIVQASGGYQHLPYNEDYYLWTRMYLNDVIFANTGTNLVYVRVGKEMYRRRGGIKYFKSEYRLQRFMYEKSIISAGQFLINVSQRLVVQLVLPNSIRGWVFQKFAREKIK
jgi:glycosyltransferase involved in cell wall biosynthesis